MMNDNRKYFFITHRKTVLHRVYKYADISQNIHQNIFKAYLMSCVLPKHLWLKMTFFQVHQNVYENFLEILYSLVLSKYFDLQDQDHDITNFEYHYEIPLKYPRFFWA